MSFGSTRSRAVYKTIGVLAAADALPGLADFETGFSPGRAHVRRVAGYSVWLLYRFDADHVTILTARDEPPVPVDD